MLAQAITGRDWISLMLAQAIIQINKRGLKIESKLS